MSLIGIDTNLLFQGVSAGVHCINKVDIHTFEILSIKSFNDDVYYTDSFWTSNGMVCWYSPINQCQMLYKLADSKVYKIRNSIPKDSIIIDIITYEQNECDVTIKLPKKSNKYMTVCIDTCHIVESWPYLTTIAYLPLIPFNEGKIDKIDKINNTLIIRTNSNTCIIVKLNRYSNILAAQLAVDTTAIIKDELAEVAYYEIQR